MAGLVHLVPFVPVVEGLEGHLLILLEPGLVQGNEGTGDGHTGTRCHSDQPTRVRLLLRVLPARGHGNKP